MARSRLMVARTMTMAATVLLVLPRMLRMLVWCLI